MSRCKPRHLGILAIIVLVTALAYWPGLHGPYLLDDIGNLSPLKRWLDDQLGWRGVVFDNRSGLLGRPVSMATFMLDAVRTGNMQSFTFKPTNLIIHLLCGLSLWGLLRRLLPRDPATRRYTEAVALFLTALWLLAPLQLSTVLYTVQRMAQLAALFVLLTLLVYMVARERLARNELNGHLLLWLAVPAITAVAALSKENGVLALPMAMALELTLFRPSDGSARPLSVKLFFALSVLLPALLAAIWLGVHPSFITDGYMLRDFTLRERLLTEPRILWSYVQTLLFPVGRNMGIYHDNYPISSSIIQPWSTLTAMLGWILVCAAAWLLRRRMPMFSAGVAMFLVGHSMESSFIALEPYFEHRNYLPSVGVWLALAGLFAGTLAIVGPLRPQATRSIALLASLLPLLYAFGTWVHAGAWSSDDLFYAMQERYNPTSPRLQSDLTVRAMLRGQLEEALEHISIGESHSPNSELATATLWRILAYCETGHAPPDALYAELGSRAHGPISNFAMNAWELLASRVERGCPGLKLSKLTDMGQAWLRQSPLAAGMQNSWRTKYNLARMLAADGHLAEAEHVNYQAWMESGFNNGIGVFQFQISASLGHVDVCRVVLKHLELAAGGNDYRLNQAVDTFRQALREGQIRPST